MPTPRTKLLNLAQVQRWAKAAHQRGQRIVATNGWDTAGPGPMITVFAPSGRVLETHPVPAKMPTNCCFGGADMTTLFVTSTQGHFFKAKTNRVGWAMYP